MGGALGVLVGLQLLISWLLMRVLEELSVRELRVAAELAGDGAGVAVAAAIEAPVTAGSP